ncbi:MAG: S8 family serine peptidase [Gemmatimonadetes bacterium]|nr:S8 family serine peptidase [Gemmatimonadota bacterium]
MSLPASPRGALRVVLFTALALVGLGCGQDDPASPAPADGPSLSIDFSNSLDAAHPSHVLSAVELKDIPEALVEELGIRTVRDFDELELRRFVSDRGLSASALASALQTEIDEDVFPDLEVSVPESRSMSIAFNDGSLSSADAEGQEFLARVQAPAAHQSRRGKKTRVAIIDTGIDTEHPAFDKKYKKGYDFLDDDKDPTDVANGVDDDLDGWVDEGFGHGTHIAGLVALSAPDAELYVYRVLDAEGRGMASDVAEAVLQAVKDKVDVINMSLGMYTDFEPLRDAVALAVDKDILVVASVGNDGTHAYPQYPASYPEVISVGSVNAADEFSVFSSFDPSLDTVSPGEELLSCMPGGGYAVWSGTSQSTAIVSGLSAMLHEIYKKELARGRMRDVLLASGSDVMGLPGGLQVKRVDFRDAVLASGGTPCDGGDPQVLTMRFTGLDCTASAHGQKEDKVECAGDPALASVVHIKATEKEDPDEGKVWFEGEVELDGTFDIDAANAGDDKLKSDTWIHISGLDGSPLQTVRIHTSCSQPLQWGDRYGSLQLDAYIAKP